VWEKDRKKKDLAEKSGYKVIYLWEKDITESKNIAKLVYDLIF
jgi:hypothetical protein